MWCALVALALVASEPGAAADGGQRYGDYGAVRMPLYGSGEYDSQRDFSDAAVGVDDYHGHSPDVPASPDYKYEEEPKGNADKLLKDKEVETADEWQKPVRNQRRRTRTDNSDYSEFLDKHSQGDISPKLKSSHRFTKHRSRHKFQKSAREYNSRGINDRKDYNDEGNIEREDEFNTDKGFRESDQHFDEDNNYTDRKSTDRIIKRKPRDKERPHSDDIRDLVMSDKRLKDDDEGEVDFRRDMMLGRRSTADRHRLLSDDSDYPQHLFDLDRRRPGDSDSDDVRQVLGTGRVRPHSVDKYEPRPPQKPIRAKEKTDEYDDFYDMKRVLDIKNRLPDLIQRTKARGAAPRPMENLDVLLTNRRAFDVKSTPSDSTTRSTITSTTAIGIIESSSLRAPSLATRTTITTTTVATTTDKKEELSLAERSRLSILKKILKKEGERNGPPIRKPAVLLQVTKKLPTVVMVEPATKREPWMRAREVSEDSPARVERAKQLMRHKLVANAKDIHDLTDNWDETICEYIDVSLLDQMSKAPRLLPPATIIAAQSIVTLCCLC